MKSRKGTVYAFDYDELLKFSGATFDPALDGKRLTTQYERVLAVMLDHGWHTLAEIVNKISYPPYDRASEAGVSARLRDCRKAGHGSRTVEHRRVAGAGLWEYRLVPPAGPEQGELMLTDNAAVERRAE